MSIIRKTFPALRATVMRDFLEIMKSMDIYEVTNHNKSEHIYQFPNGSIVEFFSVDDEQKIRGRKRDVAWCNEANELFYDDFTQLNNAFDALEAELQDKVLYRDNPAGEPNQVEQDIDMNSNKLTNVGGIEVGGVDYLASMQTVYNNYVSITQKVTVSTSSPSGGADGDIWFKVSS